VIDRSATRNTPIEPLADFLVARVFGIRVAETILASVRVRTHQQAGHMGASDLIKQLLKNLAGERAVHIWLYDTLYCAWGQAENLIKLHKAQLASDRTSCRSPLANQVRLVLHTGAYWIMLKLRDAIPEPQPLARAEFTTLRMRLLKIAARITETASRVRIAFAAACPEAALFASLARCLQPAGP
jgi:hypothetical protein